jgi:3-deoxy-D-manno-octulosonate 8-phosphate phosphatase (KDO 8-P phosphatase)
MQYVAADALERARRVRLMILDVDGVLTDGLLWYGARAGVEEIKAFHALDGLGIQMLAKSGIHSAILSGRTSTGVAARGVELGIEHVLQGIGDKHDAFVGLLQRMKLNAEQAAYMGDDLVDIPVLSRCGFACAPYEAPEEVRKRVHYVCAAPAGRGAVRELCEFVMRAQGPMDRVMQEYLK